MKCDSYNKTSEQQRQPKLQRKVSIHIKFKTAWVEFTATRLEQLSTSKWNDFWNISFVIKIEKFSFELRNAKAKAKPQAGKISKFIENSIVLGRIFKHFN